MTSQVGAEPILIRVDGLSGSLIFNNTYLVPIYIIEKLVLLHASIFRSLISKFPGKSFSMTI